METRSHPRTWFSKSGPRSAGSPPGWYWTRINFNSTCPKCGEERIQHGYSRRILRRLLSTRRKIDAYCIVCNVCWPITESERFAISVPDYGRPARLISGP
jgi:hypothetical protein